MVVRDVHVVVQSVEEMEALVKDANVNSDAIAELRQVCFDRVFGRSTKDPGQ